jgi:hypothetical protein
LAFAGKRIDLLIILPFIKTFSLMLIHLFNDK